MKKVISTSKAPAAVGPYSQAIEANGFVFISGQISLDPQTGKMVEGGVKEQTHQVLKNIKAILDSAELNFNHVIKSTVFLSDMSDFAAMNEVYAEYYTSDQPARAAFAVKGLPLGALVEIESIAIK
jgi:2-iminobutanoate/2-iminopropanoate deaminase